jgi:ribosomal protein L16/L10AE
MEGVTLEVAKRALTLASHKIGLKTVFVRRGI